MDLCSNPEPIRSEAIETSPFLVMESAPMDSHLERPPDSADTLLPQTESGTPHQSTSSASAGSFYDRMDAGDTISGLMDHLRSTSPGSIGHYPEETQDYSEWYQQNQVYSVQPPQLQQIPKPEALTANEDVYDPWTSLHDLPALRPLYRSSDYNPQAWNTYQQQSYSEPHYDSHNDAAYNNGHEVNTTPFNNWAPETIAEWMQPQHQPLPPPLPPVTSISRQQVVANIPPLGEDQLSVQMQQHQSSLCDEFAPYLWPPNHCLVCQTPFTQYNELQSYCFPFWQVFKCKHRYTNCCTTCHATYCMSVWDFSCCLPFPGPCPIGPEHHYEGHVVRNQDRTRQPHSYTPQFFCTPESQPRRENNYFLPSDDTLQSLLEGPVRSDSSGSLPSLRIDEGDFEREADSVGYIRKFRRIEPKSPDQNWRLVSKSLTRGPTGGPRFTGCKICGDKNTGDYYGAHGCCEGCRMFFKRCIKNNRAYRCIFGGNCNIRFDDRRKCCKGCRLRRCHKAGMSPELCKQQIESHAMRYRPEDVPTAVSNQQRVQLKEFCLRIPLLESSGLRVSDESNQEIDVSALDSPNGNINITAGSSISTHVVS